jgi:hypothetical protein
MVTVILLALTAGAPATTPRSAGVASPPPTVLHLSAGTAADGTATAQWLAMLRKRLSRPAYEAVAGVRKPLTSGERGWADLIAARLASWELETPALIDLFAPVAAPPAVTIVVGNRGGEDAFTHDPVTIGFDLAALAREYGGADRAENADRMDRFFRHEYVHLLQKAWIAAHPVRGDTPLRRAMVEMWGEGLGNYFSLSERWRSGADGASAHATAALAALEPRLAARLSMLACATAEQEAALTADLSSGRFDRKWGALPVALWLERETRTSPDVLRRFARAGPDGIVDFATRHLTGPLAVVFAETLESESLCESR